MRQKESVKAILFVLSLIFLVGCSTPQPPQPDPVSVDEEMTLEQAIEIAELSSCMDVGALTGGAFYNENTGTWWLDLDAKQEGCNPACVVHAVDKSTEVNWRCTGALPPKDDESDLNDEDIPLVPDPAAARDAAMSFLVQMNIEDVPSVGVTWDEADITEADLVSSSTYEYRYQNWMVVVQYPIVNPEATIYNVDVRETAVDFAWRGELNAAFEITKAEIPTETKTISCWGGFIKSLPEDAQFDDYFAFSENEGVGIQPADNTVAGQLQILTDSSTFVHIWGKLHCPAVDYGGCYIEVTKLREDKPGPFYESDLVSGWRGTVNAFGDSAQYDDYFILSEDMQVIFGIESTNESIAEQLMNLRDTGQMIKVWGEVSCGVPSPNGALIMVTQIEVQ